MKQTLVERKEVGKGVREDDIEKGEIRRARKKKGESEGNRKDRKRERN